MEKIIKILNEVKDEQGMFEFLTSITPSLKKLMFSSLGFGLLFNIFALIFLGITIGIIAYVKFTYKIKINLSSIIEKRDTTEKKESE